VLYLTNSTKCAWLAFVSESSRLKNNPPEHFSVPFLKLNFTEYVLYGCVPSSVTTELLSVDG
jgi:hypothetical protein